MRYKVMALVCTNSELEVHGREVPIATVYDYAVHAEERAARYLKYCPNDIVMVYEVPA